MKNESKKSKRLFVLGENFVLIKKVSVRELNTILKLIKTGSFSDIKDPIKIPYYKGCKIIITPCLKK